MIFKHRWLKILVITFSLVLFVAYFTFATFLFPPHEGAWKYNLAALIPRDVDFYLGKSGLQRDFAEFPRLAIMEAVQRTQAWQTLEASPEFEAWKRENAVDEQWAEMQRQLDMIPLGLDPLTIFGGQAVALAGYFEGSALEQADWALYGRLNWAGKLAIAALSYPGLLGFESAGLTATEEGGVVSLSGGQLPRPLHIARVRDVGIVSTKLELARRAVDLAAHSGEGSLYLSADYGDNIDTVDRAPGRDEFEVIVDMRDLLPILSRSLGQSLDPWPDTRSDRFLPAFMGRLFQAPATKKVLGVIGFDQGVSIDLHGSFSSEKITDAQRSIYSRPGFSHEDILREVAILAPADSALFVYIHGPIKVLLNQLFASVEPALRSNLEDAFRQTGRYNALSEVIDDIASSLHNRLALVVRENDYEVEMVIDTETGDRIYAGPPNDGQPVFSVALVTWYSDEQKLIELRNIIGQNPSIFGLQGADGDTGYYRHSVANFETNEFWAPLVPGTGVVATMNTAKHSYISNVHEMMRLLVKTATQTGYPSLAGRSDFRALLDSTIPSANMLVWVNPAQAAPTLRRQAHYNSRLNATRGIDWGRKRAEEEAKHVARLFPGRSRTSLSQAEREQLDDVVSPAMRELRSDLIDTFAPKLEAEQNRVIDYFESASAILAVLQLEPRDYRLSVRVVTPLD